MGTSNAARTGPTRSVNDHPALGVETMCPNQRSAVRSSTGPKDAMPIASSTPPVAVNCAKKAIVWAIVSSGNVVGIRISSMTSPPSDATRHTNLVPPASTPPNVMAASTRLESAVKSSYNYPC